jgi:hypothetical protein
VALPNHGQFWTPGPQFLVCVLAQRLQQPVPRAVRTFVEPHDQRLPNQLEQGVQYVFGRHTVTGADNLGSVERPVASEYGESLKDTLLRLG